MKLKLGERLLNTDKVVAQVQEQAQQIPRDVIFRDMCSFIARMPLTDEQANGLYEVVRKRVPSKSCFRCGRLKCIGFEGSIVEPNGLGRQFTCVSCQEILKEKGQL